MTGIKSGYDASYTLGKNLKKVPGVLKAMQSILTANYSVMKSNCEKGREDQRNRIV